MTTKKDEVRSTIEALRTERALKLALESLEECRRDPRLKYEHPYYDKTITAIRSALAEQPAQQEAQIVRWKCPCGNEVTFRGFTEAPASKTWAGLTDEEIEQVCVPLGAAMLSFTEVARAIEAKLREKNEHREKNA